MNRIALRTFGALVIATLLAGCAALNAVTSEVTSFSEWPADRKAGSYAFERLPSQKANAQRSEELERAAARALEKAGFTAAADPSRADVMVQIGARLSRIDVSPWNDPLWWRWGGSYWRSPAWRSARWPYYAGWEADWYWYLRYERTVAVLLRDRASGTPLYEAHAQTEGGTTGDAVLLGAMFEAALTGFPATGATNPRNVRVSLAAP